MILMYVLAACSLFAIFVLFLVLSKTLNNIMNNLIKLQYLLQKELDYKKEQLAISKLMEEQQANKKRPDEPENADQTVSPGQSESGTVKKQ
jgi:hypothetical protein